MNKEIDWIIHYVADESAFIDDACNAHTHGMENYDHMDFQLVLDVGPDYVATILNNLACMVRDGKKFQHGDMVYGIFEDNIGIKLEEFEESGRIVLRAIIPDEDSLWPNDPMCHPAMQIQSWPTDALFIDAGLKC